MEFLEKIYNNLGELLSLKCYKKQYYISFHNDVIKIYHVKTIQYKSQAFMKFLEFISQAKNQLEKKLIRYYTDRERQFDNKALKS